MTLTLADLLFAVLLTQPVLVPSWSVINILSRPLASHLHTRYTLWRHAEMHKDLMYKQLKICPLSVSDDLNR